jgi:YrbI family 3-deoxy-D-manno-octulosonate 8-phosphate phosphatase
VTSLAGVSPARLAAVDLLVLDFDGVLTDNGVWVDSEGRESVRCDRSDGLGIAALRAVGLPVLVLSTETNPVVAARCRKLALECVQGVADKGTRLRALLQERGVAAERVAYVGNDVNDLDCLRSVGLPVVVADAWPGVHGAAEVVLSRPGGHGAVRELCDALVVARQGMRPVLAAR